MHLISWAQLWHSFSACMSSSAAVLGATPSFFFSKLLYTALAWPPHLGPLGLPRASQHPCVKPKALPAHQLAQKAEAWLATIVTVMPSRGIAHQLPSCCASSAACPLTWARGQREDSGCSTEAAHGTCERTHGVKVSSLFCLALVRASCLQGYCPFVKLDWKWADGLVVSGVGKWHT